MPNDSFVLGILFNLFNTIVKIINFSMIFDFKNKGQYLQGINIPEGSLGMKCLL